MLQTALLPLIALLAFSGCQRDAVAMSTAPDEAVFGSPEDFRPIADPLALHMLRESEATASSVIGSEGGSLELIGHRIEVPPGAVRSPTLFTLSAMADRVEVELQATAEGLLGSVVNVGKRGFDKPVPVTLSYARTAFTNNPPGVDQLTVLRVFSRLGYSRYEPLPTRVDEEERTATAELEYFSRYTLGSPY